MKYSSKQMEMAEKYGCWISDTHVELLMKLDQASMELFRDMLSNHESSESCCNRMNAFLDEHGVSKLRAVDTKEADDGNECQWLLVHVDYLAVVE